MKCKTCGTLLDEQMNYCPICGTQIQKGKEVIIHLKPWESQVSVVVVWDDDEAGMGENVSGPEK